MQVPRALRFARAIALVAAAPLLAGQSAPSAETRNAGDGGASPAPPRDPSNPYLDAHCPRTQPTEGAVCNTTFTCSYGAGMCGPQCECVAQPVGGHHWRCHTTCVGPLFPPELV